MKTYLDSTVLVSLLHAQSRFKAAADAAVTDANGRAFTSTHALVETYRALTTLRLPIPPRAARQLVAGLEQAIRIVAIPRTVYTAALTEVSRQGLAGPIVYDAVHCLAARAGKARRIVTRNASHFRLFSRSIEVVELTELENGTA
ncbi:PIN domain-containing protein [Candidatus Binatia bacterium]|nr:PIN domain-containing protein [Candidatus Binatia bacterium]